MSLAGWKINGFPASDYGVEDIVVTKKNLDEDFAELKLHGDFDAALPAVFAVGEKVVVAFGDVVVLHGKVDEPILRATQAAENRSVFVYGPWHWMAKSPYLHSYDYADGPVATTHAVFKGSALSVVGKLVDAAKNAGLIASTGNGWNFTNFTVPKSETYDLTIAGAFRSFMRWLPGGALYFDYSYDPPRLFVLGPDSEYMHTFSPDLPDCSNLTVKPRYDLLLHGVRIDYEARETRKTRTWIETNGQTPVDKTETTFDGLRLIGSDTAGDSDPAPGRSILRTTVVLDGQRSVTTLNWTVGKGSVQLGNILWGNPPTESWVWLDFFMGINVPRYNSPGAYSAPTTISVIPVFTAITSGVTPPTNRSTGDKWSMLQKAWPESGYTFGYDNVALRKFPSEILYSADYPQGIKVLSANIEWEFNDPEIGHGKYSGEQYFVYFDGELSGYNVSGSRVLTDGDIEAMPTGIAAAVLSRFSALRYDGGVTVLVEDDPSVILAAYGGPQKIGFSSPAFSSLIQSRVVTASTGLADLAFGTPQHLGPQDLLALYRAGRK